MCGYFRRIWRKAYKGSTGPNTRPTTDKIKNRSSIFLASYFDRILDMESEPLPSKLSLWDGRANLFRNNRLAQKDD